MPPNSSARFAVAGPADEAAIRRLLRENPMRGAISITFEREPDYFRGAGLGDGEDQTVVAYEDERLVCMGRCTQRECWVNGEATPVGYLAELRLDASARRRFAIVRDGYRFFRELQNGRRGKARRADHVNGSPELYFTSIAADNGRARRLLESGARGLPAYEFLGELVTLLIAVPCRPRPARLRIEAASAEAMPALLRLLNQHGQRHQFAAVWTEDRLRSLAAHGLPLERFLVAREREATVACGGLWDQRAFRQTVIHGYAGALAVARPLIDAASRAFGRPRLPAPGAVLAQAFVSPLALAEGAETLLPEFVEAFFPLAAANGVQWLTLALPADDSRLAALRRRFFTRAWPSRLYRVRWPEQPAVGLGPPTARFLPDVALL